MSYSLIIELCESRLIPSRSSLKKWDEIRLTDLCYLYFLALRILLDDGATKTWAERYCAKTAHNHNFDVWRTDGNDFYVLLYALNSDKEFQNSHRSISVSMVRDWLLHVKSQDFDARTQQLFNRLDAMFRVTSSNLKAMRRTITHWSKIDGREREDVLDKIIQQIKTLANNSELLIQLKLISKQYDGVDDAVSESASAGSTGSASIATVVGGLGAGFDPTAHWRSIYGNKSKTKAVESRFTADDTTGPLYDHDCKKCRFCGQTSYRGNNAADIYLCGNPQSPTLIARYSDTPGGYDTTNLLSSAAQTPAWSSALKLAINATGKV